MLLFDKRFVFGIAESDLQTVGSADPQKLEHSSKTMWEVFAAKKGIDTPLVGSKKYTAYSEDARLIGDLGVKGYRTSISMSRTIDEKGNINKKAIAWYRKYLTGIKKKGVEIHLCLYHWEAPEQFVKDGILAPGFEKYFLRHAEVVAQELGDLVDYFIPMNELWCICFLSYLVGIHAPGYKSTEKFFQAYFKIIDLQAKTIRLLKSTLPKAKIGIVNIQTPTYILPEFAQNPAYLSAQFFGEYFNNYFYSDPFFLGSLDERIIKKFSTYFPKNWKEILATTKVASMIDYYGANYYNSQYVQPSSKSPLGFAEVIPDNALRNSLGWPVSLPPYYPTGLTDMLVAYTQLYYGFGLQKIIVSENGTPLYTGTNQEIPQDDFRIYFIQEHLKQIQNAIAKGAVVQGYFLWTLLDNYEWQEGYKPESAFGIVAVDRKTGKRTPKKSYYWYQQLMRREKTQ